MCSGMPKLGELNWLITFWIDSASILCPLFDLSDSLRKNSCCQLLLGADPVGSSRVLQTLPMLSRQFPSTS